MGILRRFGAPDAVADDPPARPKRRWKLVLKGVLGALVLVAVGRYIARTWQDLKAQGESIRLDPGWLAGSLGLYLLGLCCFGLFFWRIMNASPSPVRLAPALRAYLISHLGKYVPGKAMVVVLRAGLIAPYGARPATSAFATLYETLVMMVAGGLGAAVGFAIRPIPPVEIRLGSGSAIPLPPAWLGLGMGAGFLVLALPRVFPRFLALVSVPFPNVGAESRPRFTIALLAEGLVLSIAGWALLGMSQVAVIRAMGTGGASPDHWVVISSGVALATVAGFAVAIFPAGLGVRELVLMATLAPALGRGAAVVAALVLRLAWVAAEVLIVAVLSFARPALPTPMSAPVGPEPC